MLMPFFQPLSAVLVLFAAPLLQLLLDKHMGRLLQAGELPTAISVDRELGLF